jgi:starch synthase
MKIAFVTPEVYPFAKTGGLSDVSYSLPRALLKRGHDVRVIMPRYYVVDKKKYGLNLIHAPLGVPLGFDEKWAAIFESHENQVITYFIEYDNYFGRDGLYGSGYESYGDNAERFAFFSRAVFKALKALDFEPDIIHCNDWQTGLVPVFRKTHYATDPFFNNTATIITIHNVGYQGVFHKDNLKWTELGVDIFSTNGLEYFDQINYLKGGILFSELVTTVSRKYALEIQEEEFGYNLAPILRRIKSRLYGITNAVDYEKWNPAHDKLLPKNYTPSDLTGKEECKRYLQRRMGVSINPTIPIIGAISRLTFQKGMDVLADTLALLLSDENFQFIILGSGEEWLIERFESLRKMFPERLGVYWGYDENIAHLIEAGADMYIMPSRYEPCGLNQMYSMKYGTVPVVRSTGGLDDTVQEWDEKSRSGNGFKFRVLNQETLYKTMRDVLRIFRNREEWRIIQRNAMEFNYSWDDAALEYEDLYQLALRNIS